MCNTGKVKKKIRGRAGEEVTHQYLGSSCGLDSGGLRTTDHRSGQNLISILSYRGITRILDPHAVHKHLPNLRFHTETVVSSRCSCSKAVTWQSEC